MGTANIYIDHLPVVIENAHRILYLPDGSQHVLDAYNRPLFSSGPRSSVAIVMSYSADVDPTPDQVAPFASVPTPGPTCDEDDHGHSMDEEIAHHTKMAVEHFNRIRETETPETPAEETQPIPQVERYQPPMAPSITPVPLPQKPSETPNRATTQSGRRRRRGKPDVMYVKKNGDETHEIVLPPDFSQPPIGQRDSESGESFRRQSGLSDARDFSED